MTAVSHPVSYEITSKEGPPHISRNVHAYQANESTGPHQLTGCDHNANPVPQ